MLPPAYLTKEPPSAIVILDREKRHGNRAIAHRVQRRRAWTPRSGFLLTVHMSVRLSSLWDNRAGCRVQDA